MKRLTIIIPTELHTYIKVLSGKEQQSMTDFVLKSIKFYLENVVEADLENIQN